MTQENETIEKQVLQESEFLKMVKDFAQYAGKEYVEGYGSGRALVISAMDGSSASGRVPMVHIALGMGLDLATSLSDMMQDKRMRPLFRHARSLCSDYEDAMEEAAVMRRRLRTDYAVFLAMSLWTLLLVVMPALGMGDWIITVCSLMMMTLCFHMLVREIRSKRRRIRHLEAEHREVRMAQARRRLEDLFEKFARCAGDDDND